LKEISVLAVAIRKNLYKPFRDYSMNKITFASDFIFDNFPELHVFSGFPKPCLLSDSSQTLFFQDLPKYNTGSFFKAYTQNLKRLLIHISINRDKLVYYK